jgi:predicted permease
MKPLVVISIIVIRFVILPACGIGVVKAARELGFLPGSPLYHYVLLLQSTVPPAMSIGKPAYKSS